MANSICLPEFNIITVYEDSDGRIIMYEVEAAKLPKACPKCGCVGPHYKHTVDERIVQDISARGKLTYLKIKSRRYKCKDCGVRSKRNMIALMGRNVLQCGFAYIFRRNAW